MTRSVSQHPSLPFSFQGRTIHNPEGADIYVRWGGAGTVVVLLHGYAENTLAVGGEKSFGALHAEIMRHVAVSVQEAVVPHSGHWLMEESPEYTVNLVWKFLDSSAQASAVRTAEGHN